MAHANLPMIRLKARSISCDDWSVSSSCLGGIALRFRELIIVFLSANFVSHRKRCHRSRNLLPARLPLSPVIAPLLSRPRLPTPLLLRSPGLLCPLLAWVGGWLPPVARRAGCFANRAIFSIMFGVTRFLVRHQVILSINGLAFPIHSEAFGERFCVPALRFAGLEIDGFACELAFGLRR